MDKREQMTFTGGNPQEEPPRRVAKKSKKRFLWLALVTLLALIAVVLSVLYDRGEFDGLRRRLLYTKAQKDENGCAQLYRYASDQSGSFASLDGSLVSVSMHQVSVLDETGKTVYEQTVKFQSPALVRGASRAAAYDVGGTSVYVLTAKGLACQVDTSGEILAVAAGPACNLLLWALLSSVGGEALAPFAGAHLILGALNLLPVRPMDGGRLLWLLVSLCSEPYTADRVAYITGAAVSSALLLVCLYLTLTTGGGLFLLPGVLWLAVNGVLPNGTKHDKINCYNK